MASFYPQIQTHLNQNEAVLMETEFPDTTAEKSGAVEALKRRIWTAETLPAEKLQVLKAGAPKWMPEKKGSIFSEPFFPAERLIVLGGGHVALPLVDIAARVGFRVTLIDDRPSFASAERFPNAEKVICNAFEPAISEIVVTPNDYVVIITRGHRHDADCLRAVMKGPEPVYVGMIGSKRRIATVFEGFKAEGYDGERLRRVCAPIGLSIGSATPEEISISIVAQLIQRKRVDSLEGAWVNRSDTTAEDLARLAAYDAEKTPACLVTVMAVQGSAPRNPGAKMLVYDTGRIEGSIGGGCSEAEIMHVAVRLIGSGQWQIATVNLTQDVAEEEGMVCGGIMTVLIEDLTRGAP